MLSDNQKDCAYNKGRSKYLKDNPEFVYGAHIAGLQAVAEAAVKDAGGGEAVVHSRVWMTAPKSIWLQVDPDVDAADTDFNDQEEVTWAAGIDDCGIGENDIEYVRADLARPQASAEVPHQIAPADVPMHWRDESSNACAYAAGFNACIKLLAARPQASAAVPEDAIDAVSKAMTKAWQLGQDYWRQADGDTQAEWDESGHTEVRFQTLLDETTSMLAASQPEPARCDLCKYQHGHQIGCENNPVDISLRSASQPEVRNAD